MTEAEGTWHNLALITEKTRLFQVKIVYSETFLTHLNHSMALSDTYPGKNLLIPDSNSISP